MKVRRILALVLSAALAVTALTACTSAKDEASQKSADNQTATLSYDTVKIGVIHIGNPADGSGYTYAHDQGIVGMQKELGLKERSDRKKEQRIRQRPCCYRNSYP